MTNAVSLAQGGTNNVTMRNRIINGAFDFWQRGTSFSSFPSGSNTYTADRFASFVNGTGGTIAVTQQAVTPTTFTALGAQQDPQYYLQYQCSVLGSVTYIDLNQRIEDVRTFAGQTITVSFYAKADTTRTISLSTYQNFGSGGSVDVSGASTNVTITSSWVKYTVNLAVGSISGKTIGSGSWVAVVIALPVSTFTFSLALVQAEAGTTATPFEQRLYGTELALCQRYYQVLGTGVTTTGNLVITVGLFAPLRVTPSTITTTLTSGSGASFVVWSTSQNGNTSLVQSGNNSGNSSAVVTVSAEF